MNSTLRAVLAVALVLVILPLLWGVLMGGPMFGGMGPGMMWGAPSADGVWRWGGLAMMLPGVIILGAVVAALVWGLGQNSSSAPDRSSPTARDILDARYARGEISRDEYQQMKADLAG